MQLADGHHYFSDENGKILELNYHNMVHSRDGRLYDYHSKMNDRVGGKRLSLKHKRTLGDPSGRALLATNSLKRASKIDNEESRNSNPFGVAEGIYGYKGLDGSLKMNRGQNSLDFANAANMQKQKSDYVTASQAKFGSQQS